METLSRTNEPEQPVPRFRFLVYGWHQCPLFLLDHAFLVFLAPSDVADLMMSKMRYLQKEIVCVLALDTKGGVTSRGKAGELASDLTWGKLLNESTIFEGTLNASVFHPREIFRFAIEESANSIVLVHNHPSGDPQPSQEDIRATKQLIEAGNQIGIKVLDHIIIGDGIFVSLKKESFI